MTSNTTEKAEPEAAATGVAIDELMGDIYRYLRTLDGLRRAAQKPEAPRVRFPAPPLPSPVGRPEEEPGASTEPTPQPEPAPLPKPQQDPNDFCKQFGLPDGQPYQYTEDGASRAVMARGCIVPGYTTDHVRAATPPPFTRMPGLHRGHLIARMLGGESDNLGNISWQSPSINMSRMKSIEYAARAQVFANNRVYYETDLDWKPANLYVSKAYVVSWISSNGTVSLMNYLPN